MSLSCQEMIDEIQARVGRPNTTDLIDTTWLTRRINEAQKVIVETIPGLPFTTFKNTTSLDTTGTSRYSVGDITVGDSTNNKPFRFIDMWYLDGNESRRLRYKPPDEFDLDHPDPTHSDEPAGKPLYWTMRNNQTIETSPYCASGYWDKNLRFDGYFYPLDFTTDSTSASDLSRADEGLIRYGVWRAWEAIGVANPSVQAEIINARKAWSNPYPGVGEGLGWMEEYKDKFDLMLPWSHNSYTDVDL